MYIQEIILDGFKSYASRTVISGFDQSFNAITGLNGTGKSNIFDAICFGLGCSDWKKLRVSNQQELIYKSGQANVTKASVTLVFNNGDKEKSPIGYETYATITVTRTIAIGGRNKFLINGTVADAKRVSNLYRSVQLNINNPHFVILQGTITKTLNMKPTEILSLIEEAAGTKLFEDKKNEALKTIEKKEQKLKEIDTMLKEEITPTLEKLDKQREGFLQWSQMTTECETLARFCTAFSFYEKERLFNNGGDLMSRTKAEIAEARDVVDGSSDRVDEIEKKLAKLKQKSKDNQEFKDLEKKVTELSKILVKQASVAQGKSDERNTEKASIAGIQESVQDIKNSILKFQASEKKKSEEFENSKKENDELSTLLSNLTNQLHSLQAGIASSGSGKTLTEQLIEFKKIASNAATQASQASLKIQHMTKELAEKKKLIVKSDGESDALSNKLIQLQGELKSIQSSLSRTKFDEVKYQSKISEKETIQKEIATVKDEIRVLNSRVGKFNFEYKKDKSLDGKVKGRVANLFSIKSSKNATALEVSAGGKLYNVVVDDEKTAQKLIESGTKERVTIIPLSKIQYEQIPERIVEKAQEVSRGNADLALSLVEYDQDVKKAMEFVFGQTIVCQDIDTAEKVAFHKDVKRKTVTLKGDSFDPSGTLTGGSRTNSDALNELCTLNAKKLELVKLEEKLAFMIQEIEELNVSKAEYKKIKNDFDLKTQDVDILTSRMKGTKRSQLIEDCAQLEEDIKTENEKKLKFEELKNEKETSCKQIEKDMKNFGNQKDTQIKQIERDIESTKKKQKKINDDFKVKELALEKAKAQIETAQAEMLDLEKQIQAKNAALDQLDSEVAREDKKVIAKKADYEALKKELDEKKNSVAELDVRIVELNNDKENVIKEQQENILKVKKLESKLIRDEKDQREARDGIVSLIKENPWIKSEKANFGLEGSEYDFVVKNPSDAQKKLADLLQKQQKMSKTINRKVLSMFDKAQDDYKKLVDKKKIVETDKSKIEQVIKEVDDKKNEAIKKTWEKVNLDFGSIFSTLLQGTKAKLEPIEGDDIMKGLEVRVAFGSVWKESLSELSGGQKSLLALSLILSLLLFKPAPMYILDEVDAALDPSHTQNIGRIVKNHFGASQFIVISLKEGMFSNANVLFKTQFINGQSAIIRKVNDQTTVPVVLNKENVPFEKEVPKSDTGRKRKNIE